MGKKRGRGEKIMKKFFFSYHPSPMTYDLFFILFFFAFAVTASPTLLFAGDQEWQKMGVSDNGKFVLYIDLDKLKNINEKTILATIKRELSAEGQEDYKKWYYKEKERAEKEAGSNVQDPETFLNVLIKSETHEALYTFDCAGGKDYSIQSLRSGAGNFVVHYDLKPGSTEEKIRDLVCKKER